MTMEWMVLERLAAERAAQDAKWGLQDHDDGRWALVLVEEVGEACQASLQGREEDLKTELVQAGAVIVAWLEAINRRS